jgi:hypothetical protein
MAHAPLLITRRSFVSAALSVAALSALAWRFPALAAAPSLPGIAVSKDPNCGCCVGWVDHLRAAGFPVTITQETDLQAVKARLGVPDALGSCHTAEVAGYVLEGHVPASAVMRLLEEKPQAVGLAVPGMPIGSPGMEGGAPDTYDVILFGPQTTRPYARYRGGELLQTL